MFVELIYVTKETTDEENQVRDLLITTRNAMQETIDAQAMLIQLMCDNLGLPSVPEKV